MHVLCYQRAILYDMLELENAWNQNAPSVIFCQHISFQNAFPTFLNNNNHQRLSLPIEMEMNNGAFICYITNGCPCLLYYSLLK